MIWTTTPWTIPHNRALAFHPDYEYVVVKTEKGKLLLAADRVAALQADCEHRSKPKSWGDTRGRILRA